MRTTTMKFLVPLTAVLVAGGCLENSLAIDNPNQRTTEAFWQTQADAVAGMNAVYRTLMEDGTWARNRYWALDHRTDAFMSRSPAINILNFSRSLITNYADGFLTGMWVQPYRGVYRANQVIQNLPAIEMDAALKTRLIAEARFLRAHYHFQQALLFGNAPIVTELPSPGDAPAFSTQAEVYAFAEREALQAAQDLPWRYTGDDIGRVTRGGALAQAADAQMMQKKWAAAAATLQQIIASGQYSLLPNYRDLFTRSGDNSNEGLFEVQFGPNTLVSQGIRGNVNPRLVGPSGAGFNDTQPTDWAFQQFFAEPGRSYPSNPDPRLEWTFFWNKPGGMDVMGRTFASRYATTGPGGGPGFREKSLNETYFIKKYQLYFEGPPTNFDNDLNFKIYRLGTVYLMLAEALTETNQLAGARDALNKVRTRVGLPDVPTTLTQAQMRDWVDREHLLELAWEQQRLPYLIRQGKYNKAFLRTRSPQLGDFFVDGRSELMPIPSSEINANPDNARQNPGY
jgi:starch-binding outer membrane protein, SusD/RagB family